MSGPRTGMLPYRCTFRPPRFPLLKQTLAALQASDTQSHIGTAYRNLRACARTRICQLLPKTQLPLQQLQKPPALPTTRAATLNTRPHVTQLCNRRTWTAECESCTGALHDGEHPSDALSSGHRPSRISSCNPLDAGVCHVVQLRTPILCTPTSCIHPHPGTACRPTRPEPFPSQHYPSPIQPTSIPLLATIYLNPLPPTLSRFRASPPPTALNPTRPHSQPLNPAWTPYWRTACRPPAWAAACRTARHRRRGPRCPRHPRRPPRLRSRRRAAAAGPPSPPPAATAAVPARRRRPGSPAAALGRRNARTPDGMGADGGDKGG